MNKNQKIVGILIFCLGMLIRIYGISWVPPHLSNDEISIAYDSYSILHTGKDEHGNSMPISFQSHGTYKAPLYAYIGTISNYFLGNSEISIRLPSALLGSITILSLGWLILGLGGGGTLALVTMTVLAFTPWHIYTSHMALEANIALFFLITGLACFFNKKIIISFLSFGLSIWAYHSEWVLVPILICALTLIYKKYLLLNKSFWIGLLLFFAIVFPIAKDAYIQRNSTARANTEIIIKDPGIAKVLKNPNVNMISKAGVVLDSFLNNYSNYNKLGYLFFDGLRLLPKGDPFTMGLFLAPLFPFFIVGLFCIKKYFEKNYLFIYVWIISSPVVSAITLGSDNFVRNLVCVAPYCLVIACGLVYFFNKYKKYIRLFIFINLVWFGYFLILYFYHFPRESGEGFQYGYKQIAEVIENSNYKKVVVDPRFGPVNIYAGVPHLYLSYFIKVNPLELINRKNTEDGMFFDKYQIKDINWGLIEIEKDVLYVVPVDNKADGEAQKVLKIIREIKLPNGHVEFLLYTHI